MNDDELGQALVLARAWFPGREIDEQCVGDAIWLERHRAGNLKNIITEAICVAFRGR